MSENLMDIKQVADYLQMNKMTIYKLARENKIPAFKVASEWRFRKDLIDNWLMSQLKGVHAVSAPQLSPASGKGKKVLIVDDEQIIRDFFARTLTEYQVLTASSGEEALDVIRREHPDLVLLDLKMPGIDGIETLRRIKELDNSIAVVMLSAFGSMQTNIEAARMGAFTSLAKPFDVLEMKPIIYDAIQSVVAKAVPAPSPSYAGKKREPKKKK